ncbi:MAG: NUDIX domain-containing protein [Gammaproteobacteria bacterium]
MARDTFPIIAHTILRRGDDVLLLRRVNTGFADGLYALPGGHVKAGEPVTGAAVRECREETGLTIEVRDLVPVCVMPYIMPGGQGVDFIFRCERFTGEPRIGEHERCDELRWCHVDALPTNTVGFVREVVAHVAQDPWLIEHGWESG